ncbi:MAG: hypothetical protein MJ055_04880 [Phascolarctobacterium sp.]|nr:hypothetical protein [Phascolarctobacterium sp.]
MSKLLKYIFIPVIAFAIFYFCSLSSFAEGRVVITPVSFTLNNRECLLYTCSVNNDISSSVSMPITFYRPSTYSLNCYTTEPIYFKAIYVDNGGLVFAGGPSSNFQLPVYGSLVDYAYDTPRDAYDALMNYQPSKYDDTIGDVYLTKSLFYYKDSNRDTFDAMCTLWAFGAFNVVGIPIIDKLEYKLYLNDVLVDTFTEIAVPVFPISEFWDTKSFIYSHYDAEPGDIFRCELVPFNSNGDYGKTSSISWIVELTSPIYNGINDNPNVEPYKVVQDVPIEPFIAPQVTTITAPSLPPQYITYYTTNYTTDVVVDTSQITSILGDINAKLDLIVSSSPEPNEPYEWKINFGSNSQEQYDKGKGHIKEWGDNVTSYLGLLVGTPFEDIFDSIVTYIAVIGGIAFVLVAIKVVGLIL